MPTQPHTVAGNEIVEKFAPGRVSVEHLAPLQRAGIHIVLGVGIFSLVAFLLIMSAWISHLPATPGTVVDSATGRIVIEDTDKTFETYRQASEIAAEQPLKWFDGLFTKMLYPLLTLVLGYVFGAGKTGAAIESGDET